MALLGKTLSGNKYSFRHSPCEQMESTGVFQSSREPLKTPSLGRSTFPAKPWLFQDSKIQNSPRPIKRLMQPRFQHSCLFFPCFFKAKPPQKEVSAYKLKNV